MHVRPFEDMGAHVWRTKVEMVRGPIQGKILLFQIIYPPTQFFSRY